MTLPFSKQENTVQYSDVKKYFLHEIDSYKIVFIDGVLAPSFGYNA
jgi:Fe-S cluster assembly protein SufD